MITFSAAESEGVTSAQVQALIRAGDPLYELMMPIQIHRKEDKFWKGTLQNLAKHFGVETEAEMSRTVVDKKRQWAHWRNLRSNAAIRTMLHTLWPFRRKA
jgi:hypothetical protein